MASGHVNRIKRPNTWLHRPMLQNVKKALANTEPSTHGTQRRFAAAQQCIGYRGIADSGKLSVEQIYRFTAQVAGKSYRRC
jgi:hypothetical protein